MLNWNVTGVVYPKREPSISIYCLIAERCSKVYITTPCCLANTLSELCLVCRTIYGQGTYVRVHVFIILSTVANKYITTCNKIPRPLAIARESREAFKGTVSTNIVGFCAYTKGVDKLLVHTLSKVSLRLGWMTQIDLLVWRYQRKIPSPR